MLMNNQPESVNLPGAMVQHPDAAPSPASQIDLARLAWRYRFLLILGLLAGLGGGYYHYIQSPELYLSSARVQIVEPVSNNLPVQGLESNKGTRSLGDEAMVMRSEGIVRRAVELGELNQTPGFLGRPPESVAGALAGSQNLRIAPATDKSQTSIFQISYQANDPVTSQRVVQAIVDAYGEHLKSRYQNVGKETLDLIHSAREDVLKRLEELEAEYDQFRQTSPLVIRQGQTTSVHRDNADKFLAQKQSLLVRKAQLDSTLRAARSAMSAGEPLESILLAIGAASLEHGLLGTAEMDPQNVVQSKVKRLEEESRLLPSEQLRETRLLPLEIQVNELKQQFGSGHPAVKAVQGQITVVQTMLERMERSEAEFAAKRQEIVDAEAAEGSTPLDREGRLKRNLQLKILALRQQLVSVEQELDVIGKSYEFEQEAAKSENAAEMTVARFEREITRQQSLYDRIVARLDEINIVSESGSLRVFALDSAQRGYKTAPQMSKSLMMGGLLGLMLAGGLAYLRELSDKSYRSAEQVAEHLRMPVIGHVPTVKAETKLAAKMGSGIDPFLVSYFRPKSSSSEAFKAIRTAIYFSNRSGDFKVIQVTSPTPGDGKSTIAANLAITMAQSGKSVLLMDTDLRRPRVQKLFGIKNERGLAWLLDQLPKSASAAEVRDLVGEVANDTEIDNLTVIGAGTRPDNPSELLSSGRFDSLLAALRGLFDVIIVDSPPMLAVTDPSTVASRVDAVLLVVRIRKNVKPLAARAARMLETLEANVLGVVVNGIGSRDAKGYGQYADTDGYYNRGQYYQYGYGYTYGNTYGGKYNEYYSSENDHPIAKKKPQEPAEVSG